MFKLSADIKISSFKSIKPNKVSWKQHIDNYSDTAVFTIPAICKLKKQGDAYDNKVIPSAQAFREGMPVEIRAGYDGNYQLQFKGFLRRMNYSVPLEVECEGYSYQLRMKYVTKSYKNTTVRTILEDLIKGTDIRLSKDIPSIPISKVVFMNATGIDVLDWFKEKCLLTVNFHFDVLYVGLRGMSAAGSVQHRLGWNVVKDGDLKFDTDRQYAQINIKIEKTTKKGEKKTGSAGTGSETKVLKVEAIEDERLLKQIAEEKKRQLNNVGYTGSITAFLEPYAQPGMSSVISDGKYPERSGRYFIEGVQGSVSTSGGRQKIAIRYSL